MVLCTYVAWQDVQVTCTYVRILYGEWFLGSAVSGWWLVIVGHGAAFLSMITHMYVYVDCLRKTEYINTTEEKYRVLL